MRTYNNDKEISEYSFRVPVTVNCPLGKNYYRATVLIRIILRDKIVDFLDLEHYFKSELNGMLLTTEHLAAKICEDMAREYNPSFVRCEVVSDSHFEIHTIKEWHHEEKAK